MFDELESYTSNGHFFLSNADELDKVCNAPNSGNGVFLIYALKGGKIELVYIGSSGKIKQKGRIKSNGIYDSLVNGIQFDKPRRISLKEQIKSENIEALDIYWYETFNSNFKDIPNTIQGVVLQSFYDMNGTLPRWNHEY